MSARRVIAALLLALMAVGVGAVPAQAASHSIGLPGGGGCDSPPPAAPGLGVSAFFTATPDPIPAPGDPWAKNSSTTIYEQFGLAPFRWRTCDLNASYIPDAANTNAVGTTVGNWALLVPLVATALYADLASVAFHPDSWMGVLNPILTRIVDGLDKGLTTPLLAVVLLIAGLAIMWFARHWPLSRTVGVVAMAVLVAAGLGVLTNDPSRFINGGGNVAATVVGGVNSSTESTGTVEGRSDDPAKASVGHVVDVVLYQQWLSGMFGSADSDTARKYGPILFDASALTWSQAQTVHDDPDAGKKIIEDKKQTWSDTMATIKDKDPDAYEYATGRDGDNRVAQGFLALLAALCALPLLLMSGLFLAAFPLFLLVGIAALVVVAPLAILPGKAPMGYVKWPFEMMLGAGVNAIILGAAAAVQVLAIGILFEPATKIPAWLGLLLLGLLTYVLWRVTKPHRRLANTVGHRAHRHFGRPVWGLAKAAVTGTAAGLAAEAAAGRRHDEEAEEARERREAEEEKSATSNAAAGMDREDTAPEPVAQPEPDPTWWETETAIRAAKARLAPPKPLPPAPRQPMGRIVLPSGPTWQPVSSPADPIGAEPAEDEPEQAVHEVAAKDDSDDVFEADAHHEGSVWTPKGGEQPLADALTTQQGQQAAAAKPAEAPAPAETPAPDAAADMTATEPEPAPAVTWDQADSEYRAARAAVGEGSPWYADRLHGALGRHRMGAAGEGDIHEARALAHQNLTAKGVPSEEAARRIERFESAWTTWDETPEEQS